MEVYFHQFLFVFVLIWVFVLYVYVYVSIIRVCFCFYVCVYVYVFYMSMFLFLLNFPWLFSSKGLILCMISLSWIQLGIQTSIQWSEIGFGPVFDCIGFVYNWLSNIPLKMFTKRNTMIYLQMIQYLTLLCSYFPWAVNTLMYSFNLMEFSFFYILLVVQLFFL